MAEDAVLRMVYLLGADTFTVQVQPGHSIIVTEKIIDEMVSNSANNNTTGRNPVDGGNDDTSGGTGNNTTTTNGGVSGGSSNSSGSVLLDGGSTTLSQAMGALELGLGCMGISSSTSTSEDQTEEGVTGRCDRSTGVITSTSTCAGTNTGTGSGSGIGGVRSNNSTNTRGRVRVLHLECGNMFDVKNINIADIVMLETDIPADILPDLHKLLGNMKPGARTLTYLDLRKTWMPSSTISTLSGCNIGIQQLPFRQLEHNKNITDRFPTSWSVQRGHHFYLWSKVSLV